MTRLDKNNVAVRFNVSISRSDLKVIDRYAKKLGISRSEFLRKSALDAVEATK